MTMPHLQNCDHQGEGWCLDCVKNLYDDLQRARRETIQECIKKVNWVPPAVASLQKFLRSL